MKIALVQPRYPHGKSQIYLPGGLMNLGSRLFAAGLEVDLFDRNLDPLPDHRRYDVIGYSVLGPPYIPSVIAETETLRERGFTGSIIIGGEGVARIRQADFDAWFGTSAAERSIDDASLCQVLKLSSVPSAFETSMRPMLERLPPVRQQQYLTREFCLFFSQGCKFNCNFCAADKARPEQYRSAEAIRDEIEYICRILARADHARLECYLSNLDSLQSSEKLRVALETVNSCAENEWLKVRLRGLATSRSAIKLWANHHGTLDELKTLREYGLHTIGFGADGADEEVWKRENKLQNNLDELRQATELMKEVGIRPEILMVFGFKDDTVDNLRHSLKFSFEQARRGCVIRPYLGKSYTPAGNWPAGELTETFRRNPELLLNLDYAMLGSEATHPDPKQRRRANRAYLKIISSLAPLGRCPTRPLMPVPERGSGRWFASTMNRFMPFDR